MVLVSIGVTFRIAIIRRSVSVGRPSSPCRRETDPFPIGQRALFFLAGQLDFLELGFALGLAIVHPFVGVQPEIVGVGFGHVDNISMQDRDSRGGCRRLEGGYGGGGSRRVGSGT